MLLEGWSCWAASILFRLTFKPSLLGGIEGEELGPISVSLGPSVFLNLIPNLLWVWVYLAKPAPILGMGVGCGLSGSTIFGPKSGLGAGLILCPPISCFNPLVKAMEVVQVVETTFDVFSACWVSFGEASFRSTRFAGGLGYSDRD